MAYAQQKELRLYNGPAPGSEDWNWEEKISTRNSINLKAVYNVVHPSLTVFAPEPGKGNGTALIVCPGGGMHFLAIDHEGTKVAKWLVKKGVTVFVLKYRVFHISHDNPVDEMINTKDPAAWDREAEPYIPLSIADGRQAITYVRQHATEFQVAPDRIGIMGFSAGGHLASTAGTHFNKAVIDNPTQTSLRPDFMILAYPVISFQDSICHKGSREQLIGKSPAKEKIDEYSNELQVTTDTPPTFLVHASDDDVVKVQNSIVFYEHLVHHRVPAELHVYQNGGHGFGLVNRTNEGHWLDWCKAWMTANGWLKPPAAK